jgi:hypothetical protein
MPFCVSTAVLIHIPMTTDAKEARENQNATWCTTRCGALQECQ